jgi:hypothetical protein
MVLYDLYLFITDIFMIKKDNKEKKRYRVWIWKEKKGDGEWKDKDVCLSIIIQEKRHLLLSFHSF